MTEPKEPTLFPGEERPLPGQEMVTAAEGTKSVIRIWGNDFARRADSESQSPLFPETVLELKRTLEGIEALGGSRNSAAQHIKEARGKILGDLKDELKPNLSEIFEEDGPAALETTLSKYRGAIGAMVGEDPALIDDLHLVEVPPTKALFLNIAGDLVQDYLTDKHDLTPVNFQAIETLAKAFGLTEQEAQAAVLSGMSGHIYRKMRTSVWEVSDIDNLAAAVQNPTLIQAAVEGAFAEGVFQLAETNDIQQDPEADKLAQQLANNYLALKYRVGEGMNNFVRYFGIDSTTTSDSYLSILSLARRDPQLFQKKVRAYRRGEPAETENS